MALPEFEEYLTKIDDIDQREYLTTVLTWIKNNFPQLTGVIKWNQPMFTDHGTYIIGFSLAKHHMSVAPELKTMAQFADQIAQAGYSSTKGLFRIRYDQALDYDLLAKLIEYNIEDKKDYDKFWR
ncbi:iron chaperone [Vaginisenegalia massiliensis]|uniref:iron chaperone n=1 Tax=Vaginisenegalia massiliensis TaxID=2058294 RepID=UPI001F155F95|nr:iron chaperone [Vaginisenegalia massiliensis]